MPQARSRLARGGTLPTSRQRFTPSVAAMMREVLHTLGNIDCQHQLELDRLATCNTDQSFKNDIRNKLVLRHRERREPYLELLTTLRQQQHRLALAA